MLRRIFLQDLGTKLLALTLALAIYVHVFSTQEREMDFLIPLHVRPIPAGLLAVEEIPKEARVRVRAKGEELLRLRARDFHAEVHLDGPAEGQLQRPLVSSDIQIPSDVHPGAVEVLEPKLLRLTFEPAARAQRPVAVRLKRGALPADRALRRRPTVDVPLLEVTAARSVLAKIDSIETEPVDVLSDLPSQEHRVALRLPAGVQAALTHVTARIDLEERATRRLGPFPIEIAPLPAALRTTIRPDSATLFVTGAASVVQSIVPQRIRLIATPRTVSGSATRAAIRAVLGGTPSDAIVWVRVEPESVVVRSP